MGLQMLWYGGFLGGFWAEVELIFGFSEVVLVLNTNTNLLYYDSTIQMLLIRICRACFKEYMELGSIQKPATAYQNLLNNN